MSNLGWEEAIAANDVEKVKSLAAADPERMHKPVRQGITPLLYALYHRADDVARWLHENTGALDVFEAAAMGETEQLANLLKGDKTLVNARSRDGFTPLHLAAFFGRPLTVGVLLRFGADANAEADNDTRVRPVHSAAASRDANTMKALLDDGADVNAQQAGGFTALHSVALHGNEDMVGMLLEAGADVSIEADDGRDAAAFAREGGHEELAERLQKR